MKRPTRDVKTDVRFVALGPYAGSRWIIADAAVPATLVAPGGVVLVSRDGELHPRAGEAAATERDLLTRGQVPARRMRRPRRRPAGDALFEPEDMP